MSASGRAIIPALSVTTFICPGKYASQTREREKKKTYSAACKWWEHPQILIPRVWDRAARRATDTGERCIVYLCIFNATPSAASLISDIPHDVNDVLKACICHHPSFGVNLKVAALWMSTPSHVDLFKCHRSLFCNCGAGQTKGEGAAWGGACWHMSFFFFPPEESQMTYNQPGPAGVSFNTWRGRLYYFGDLFTYIHRRINGCFGQWRAESFFGFTEMIPADL